jgi:diguanylate cyclase (GGDEF)-like protein
LIDGVTDIQVMSAQRRLGGFPLAVYVGALLVLPLAAVAAFSVREVSSNNRSATAAAAVADATEVHALTSAVLVPLEIERTVMMVLATSDELGIDRADVAAATGHNFEQLLAGNGRDLDAALQALGVPLSDTQYRSSHGEVTSNIDQARLDSATAMTTVDEVRATYDRAFEHLDELLVSSRRSLGDSEFESLGTAAAVNRVDLVTEIVTTARWENSAFSTSLAFAGEMSPMDMVSDEVRHLDALAAARTALPEEVSRLDRLRVGLVPLTSFQDFSLDRSDDNFDIAEVRTVADALMTHLDYLQQVGEFARTQSADILAQVDDIAIAAHQRNRVTLMVLVAVGIASAIFGFVVTHSFVRPLNLLRLQAERITGGELNAEAMRVDGPSDIRKVTHAINDMAGTLALVEEHMEALAGAEVGQRPYLRQLPGHVGASMRTSMERVTALTSRLQMSESRLAEEARIDNLTGLANRFAVLEYLEHVVLDQQQAADRGMTPRSVGVMFLDVDGFKSVNDSHGHAVGDVVLREIARRLSRSIRDIDFVARLGGDEFIVVVCDIVEPERLVGFGQRMIEEIEQPYTVGDQLFVVSASVGVTVLAPGDSSMSAIERADAAVYQAKQRGRRRVEMFDKELQRSIEQQAEIELGLRQAIQHGELRMYLQPLADLTTGLPAGAEALVRWERPGFGLIAPGSFISIAERSGLIFELERWVLDAACRRLAGWKMMGQGAGMRLAVNISGRHLIEGDLIGDLDRALAATGADPNMLEIELTESQLLDDVDRASALLSEIRDRGIKVAIDDFGTGYSSMTYLQKLPVDIVKIDRSFIVSATTSEFDSTIVDTVVTIGRALTLDIVAEGIETIEQLAYAMDAGVTLGQGFFLARPMPAGEAEAVIFNGPLFDLDLVRRSIASASPGNVS